MIQQIIYSVFHFFKTLDISGVFLSMFIENIGIPIPTEIGYLLGQQLINIGEYSFSTILLILTLGHLSGALVAYRIGLWGDSYVTKRIKKNTKVKEVHETLNQWYEKWGNLTVFLARFIGYVRPWSSFVAGFAGVPFWPFLIWTALGSLIFNIMAMYFTGILIMIWRKYSVYHVLITVSLLLLFFAFIIYHIVKAVFKKKSKIRD